MFRVLLDRQALPDLSVLQVSLELVEFKEHPVQPEALVPLARLEQQEAPALLVRPERQALLELQVFKEHQAQLVRLGLSVQQVLQVRLEFKGLRVLLVQLDLLVLQEVLDLSVPPERRARQVLLVQLVLLE